MNNTFKDYKKEALKDPNLKKEYDKLEIDFKAAAIVICKLAGIKVRESKKQVKCIKLESYWPNALTLGKVYDILLDQNKTPYILSDDGDRLELEAWKHNFKIINKVGL